MEGHVKWFISEEGYGYITPDPPPRRPDRWWRRREQVPEVEDVFVHYSAIQMTGYKYLEEGQWVSFDIKQERRGPRASNVEPMD